MQRVDVKQLKTWLSEYSRAMRRGETILVTDRGEVVAELRPARPRSAAASLDEILDALSARGEITRAAIRKGRWTWKCKGLGLPSGTAAELLDELRSDRY
jgi:antitoxin (DNA-binding transcriptional repressor) of toxin-antitoxin stability system